MVEVHVSHDKKSDMLVAVAGRKLETFSEEAVMEADVCERKLTAVQTQRVGHAHVLV